MRISDWSSDVCSSDLQTEFREESLVIAQKIKQHAEAKGMSAADFAINWVLANPIVTSVLAGPRTLEQWQAYLGALDHGFDAEAEALPDSLVAPGHPSPPGYSAPARKSVVAGKRVAVSE